MSQFAKTAVVVAALCYALPLWAQGGEAGAGAPAALYGDAPSDAGMDTPAPTLSDVLEAAYARSAQLQVMQARREHVNALRRQAESLIADHPSVLTRHQTDRPGSDQGLREYEIGVAVPLWRIGQRDAGQVLADRSGTALGKSEAALRLVVAGQVRDAMWHVALMQSNLALARQESETARALERDVEHRVRLGELARTDLLLARDETLRRESSLLQAHAALAQSRDQYTSITGLDRLPRLRGETRSALSGIVGEHPLLAEADAGFDEARARLATVREASGGNPGLLLAGKRQRGGVSQEYVNSLDIVFTLPIGTAAHSGPRITEAARAAAEAQAARDVLRRHLRLKLQEAVRELESAEAALRIAGEQDLLARENLRLARVAFSVGETDLVGLLRVQSLAFSAQRSMQELRITRQRGIARYNQALGVLP